MTVHFTSLQDVREFVGLATLQGFPVHVMDGQRLVNAKSFMEMFTVDFTAPLDIQVTDPEDARAFARAAEKFII